MKAMARKYLHDICRLPEEEKQKFSGIAYRQQQKSDEKEDAPA